MKTEHVKQVMALITGSLLCAPVWGADEQVAKAQVLEAQHVLADLHHANQMEIQMGKMAKEKGASDQVRSYGEKLVKDHQDADKQVQALAEKDGIRMVEPNQNGLVKRVKNRHEESVMSDLAQKTGDDFDKAFAKAMIDDHKKDISKLEKAEKDVQQADVRDLIAKLLPTLQQHLQIAQQIQQNS